MSFQHDVIIDYIAINTQSNHRNRLMINNRTIDTDTEFLFSFDFTNLI